MPLTRDLLPAAREFYAAAVQLRDDYRTGRWFPPDGANYMYTPVEVVSAFNPAFIDALARVLRLSRAVDANADLEDLACALDTPSQVTKLNNSGWTADEVRRARKDLDAVLGLILMGVRLTSSGQFEFDFNLQSDVYRRLAGLAHIDDSFITLNYDYRLEFGLSWDERCEIEYGFPYDLVDLSSRRRKRFKATSTQQVLHLHGALSWLYCEKCRDVKSSIDPADAINGWLLTPELYLDGSLETYYRCTCGAAREPLLISPALHKRFGNPLIEKIWMLAETALRGAETWVSIGCSFRSNDRRLASLLVSAQKSRPRPPHVVIVTDRCDAALLEKLQSLFIDCEIREGGLEAFLQNRATVKNGPLMADPDASPTP
ncbi:MAG: hypothetical protein WDN25_24865 [Acetobacteraceae bacterium]